MADVIHGTKRVRRRRHPVLDIRHWEQRFPIGKRRGNPAWIDRPRDIAIVEQSRRLASAKGKLGKSVPADLFVWADTPLFKQPWLTRIGGRPWREKGRPWPKASDGSPLVFLGQVCFADSVDILPFKLPGDVALVFGTASTGWVSAVDECALEWSCIKLDGPEDPYGFDVPRNGELPFVLQGVIHRTRQYTDRNDRPFRDAGFKEGGWNLASVQASSIGTYAQLPQGWPFEEGDGNTLIATLSSFYCRGQWPMCDVPHGLMSVQPDGTKNDAWNRNAIKFGVGDAGCLWIYRDKNGVFRLDESCG